MKLEDSLPILSECCNKKFSILFNELPIDLKTNKGHVGQLLLQYIGLGLDNKLLDFENGELKTNKSDKIGLPLETMFITQISKNFDDLINNNNFYYTNLYKKISNLVYLSVCKKYKICEDWYFVNCYHIALKNEFKLIKQLEIDYYSICKKIKKNLNTGDNNIHTANGELIQIRSKDSKPYHPIYSNKLKRYVSNKNHSCYFKKSFMLYVIKNFTPVNANG